MQEADSMSQELYESFLATPLQETNLHPDASAAPGDSPKAPGSQPLSDHDGEKVVDIFENINKDTVDCELGEIPEKLEAPQTIADITALPYSKLIPLMIGLCAGMLLSSMDSVSEYKMLPNSIPKIELTSLFVLVFDNALPRVIRYVRNPFFFFILIDFIVQMLTRFQFLSSGFDALDKIGWINVVFAMTTASFIPLYGSFSDIFGVS
jgi:hypothetical protein